MVLLVSAGLIALAFFGLRMAHRAGTGRASMQRFYALLALEVLTIMVFAFSGGVVSLWVAFALVIQVATFLTARRPRD